MVHCIWLNNKTVSECEKRAGATVGFFYLEPTPVINDRARNPTRHEFCIGLFLCAHAVLPDLILRDQSARLRHGRQGKKKAMRQIMWRLLINCVEYVIILEHSGSAANSVTTKRSERLERERQSNSQWRHACRQEEMEAAKNTFQTSASSTST